MLNNRQTKVIVYIMSFSDGISIRDLSLLLECSERTIRNDIDSINNILKADGKIETDTNKICTLNNYTVKLLTIVEDSFNSNIEEIYDTDRTHRIIQILLFEDDYMSMENLASRLHISKSMLSKVFNSSWKLRKYIEVNPTKGLIIAWSERKKRDYISKNYFFSHSFFNHIKTTHNYYDLYKQIISKLAVLFIKHEYYITGDALKTFGVYIVLSVIRSLEMNCLIEELPVIPTSSLMNSINDLLVKEYSIKLESRDLIACQYKLNELNVLMADKDLSKEEEMITIKQNYNYFVQKVKEDFGIEIEMNEVNHRQFLFHMYKLSIRSTNKVDVRNFSKRDINTNYPLTTFLIREYFIQLFDFAIAESEVAFIVLYFASSIEESKESVDILLVSDSTASIMIDIENKIGSIENVRCKSIPTYAINEKVMSYDAIITTEYAVVVSNPQALLVSHIISKLEMEIINQYVNAITKRKRENKLEKLINKYVVIEQSSLVSISDLEGKFNLGNYDFYDFVLNNNIAYFNAIGTEPTTITEIRLNSAVEYKDKSITKVVIAQYNLDDYSIYDYFYVIRSLIQNESVY